MPRVAGKYGGRVSTISEPAIVEIDHEGGATVALAGCVSYDIPVSFCLRDADSKYRPLYPARVLDTSTTGTSQILTSETIAKMYDNTSAGLADNPDWDGELGFIDESAGVIVTKTSGAAVVTFVSRSTATITSSGTPNLTVEVTKDLLTVGGFTTGNTMNEIAFLKSPLHIDKNEDMTGDMDAALVYSGTLDYSKLNADAKLIVDKAFAHPETWVGFLSKFKIINRES